MNSKGFLLPDLLIGLTMGIMVSFTAVVLIRTMIVAARRTAESVTAVRSVNDAIDARRSESGLVRSLRTASGATALSTGSISLTLPAESAVAFSVSASKLYRTKLTVPTLLASDILSMSASYYTLVNGAVTVSTAAESVDFVSLALVVRDRRSAGMTRRVYAGGWVRNR